MPEFLSKNVELMRREEDMVKARSFELQSQTAQAHVRPVNKGAVLLDLCSYLDGEATSPYQGAVRLSSLNRE